MEFYVYDNYNTFKKRNPVSEKFEPVKDVVIPPNGAFWFATDYEGRDGAVNTDAPYVHIHRNLRLDPVKFDRGAWCHAMSLMHYDHKKKELIIGSRKWLRTRVLWRKIVLGRYYGDMPGTNMRIERIMYDPGTESLHCILSYFSVNDKAVREERKREQEHADKLMREMTELENSNPV